MLNRGEVGHHRWILLLMFGTGPVLLTGCDDPVEPVPDDGPARIALTALYEETNGHGWDYRDNWLTDAPLGSWYGVEVDQSGRVVGLDLSWNGLTGVIPPELGNLTHLAFLNLSVNNRLTGPVPETFATLHELTVLHLHDCDLTGPIPAALGNLNGLESLQLDDNRLTGPIPAELGNLAGLTELFLYSNELTGPIPAELGDLANLTSLLISGNRLSGPIPAELGNLASLTELELGINDLSGPIPAVLGNLANLTGLGLFNNELTGPIPSALGNLTGLEGLYLSDNRLTGPIPAELGNLARLRGLGLSGNELTGPIPPELGNLANLRSLSLSDNRLTGPIPPEITNLANLQYLWLDENDLTGLIPRELGNLDALELLSLGDNDLTGPIPPEIANLANLQYLWLGGNGLTGPIPPQLGDATHLESLDLSANELTGSIPPSLGNLGLLSELNLSGNDLEGTIPAYLGDLVNLTAINLGQNPRLSGEVPGGWTDLRLRTFLAGETGVCAPDGPEMVLWLESIPTRRVHSCRQLAAYLVQVVQSRGFPVPLVAGEDAVLRVFPTAERATDAGLPRVRASFYLDGTEAHVVEIAGKSTPIPTTIDEGSLLKSANAEIPGELVRPGLEMVIEIDPERTLDPDLGVAGRIPENGRLALQVEIMPPLDFVFLPFLWSEDPDSAILRVVQEMADSPSSHELLAPTLTLLPVAGVTAEAHEPVWTSTNDVGQLFREMQAIRIMERGSPLIGDDRYLGMMSGPVDGGTGLSARGGRFGFVVPRADAITRQVGHLLNLRSVPCEAESPDPYYRPDPYYPYDNGSIGAWGYDPGADELVSPATPDLMSYCGPVRWISDYHFTNAYSYRLVDEHVRPSVALATTRSLLLWGGADADGRPYLEPALVVDAPPALPLSDGDHEVTGRTASSEELFSLCFAMPVVGGGGGGSSFVFAIPAEGVWGNQLARITLSGPGGDSTLDLDTDRPVTILRNPETGQVRAILRGSSVEAVGDPGGLGDRFPLEGIEVVTSRGIPDADAWKR